MAKILNKNHPDYPEFMQKLDQLGKRQVEEWQSVERDDLSLKKAAVKRHAELRALIAEYDRCYIYTDEPEKQNTTEES